MFLVNKISKANIVFLPCWKMGFKANKSICCHNNTPVTANCLIYSNNVTPVTANSIIYDNNVTPVTANSIICTDGSVDVAANNFIDSVMDKTILGK